MADKNRHTSIVLSIFPSRFGFGFAVFRGPTVVLDYGTRGFTEGRNKNTASLQKAADLIALYRPDVVVLEDYAGEGSRRSERVGRLIGDLGMLAERKGITVASYSRAEIRECFAEFGAWTKQEIAEAIGKALPQFTPLVPRALKVWEKERRRMQLFDAIALVFTHLYFQMKRKRAA